MNTPDHKTKTSALLHELIHCVGFDMERAMIVVPYMGAAPHYATSEEFSAAAFIFYNHSARKAAVVLVDGNHGASITNAADELIPYLQRQHIGRHNIRWSDVSFIYRDSFGAWDQIILHSYAGGRYADIDFRTLGDRSMAAAMRTLKEWGFALDSHAKKHISNACKAADNAVKG